MLLEIFIFYQLLVQFVLLHSVELNGLKNDFITLLFIKLYRFIIYFQDIFIRGSNESFEIKKLTKMFSRGSSIVNPKLHYYIMAIPRKVATETIILNFLY